MSTQKVSQTSTRPQPESKLIMAAPIFQQNERVLCYHGPLIYEAKVLKIEHWDESNTKLGTVGPHYFVHYKGWKQTYVQFPFTPPFLSSSRLAFAFSCPPLSSSHFIESE